MTPRVDPATLSRRDLWPDFPDLKFERSLWKKGLRWIGGIDEAGRGAWAGPVSAAVVILPREPSLSRTLRGVRDSKQMTPLQREAWAPRIKEIALAWSVGFASAEEIDTIGILPATKLAATRAIESLSLSPDYLITDYLIFPEIPLPQTALVKGDRRSLTVAAASVLAKTARDTLMRKMDSEYPEYGLARHKGYGTPQHRAALAHWGMCSIHRKSFNIKHDQNLPQGSKPAAG
jgi:ribonuclease HII